jgi:hypothetical protein
MTEIIESNSIYKDFDKNSCVKITKVDHPTSRYVFDVEATDLPTRNRNTSLVKLVRTISDTTDGSILNKATSYSYNRDVRLFPFKSCYKLDKKKFPIIKGNEYFYSALAPNKHKQQD